MAFVTGLLLIDAPASALNNAGTAVDKLYDNEVAVKAIGTRGGAFPYVSAQAFRYWLRTTLERSGNGWRAAPVYREDSVAYTDANPIAYWDDDLFGYMRAPGNHPSLKERRKGDPEYAKLTPLDVDAKGNEQSVTRVSPFRVSTLVSIARAPIVRHFESMSRHDGDPVPYGNQFYRTTLRGLFSLDLRACGTFSCRSKTGFRNLDEVRKALAKGRGMEEGEDGKAYRLPLRERVERVAALFDGLARLEGGAKQTLHYTDVAPAVVILAVTRGGNHIFGHVFGANGWGVPELRLEALEQSLTVFRDDLLSDVYVGWVTGYLDEERSKLERFASTARKRLRVQRPDPYRSRSDGTTGTEPGESEDQTSLRLRHPREALLDFVADLQKTENEHWLE